jgi:hypothetical protein
LSPRLNISVSSDDFFVVVFAGLMNHPQARMRGDQRGQGHDHRPIDGSGALAAAENQYR